MATFQGLIRRNIVNANVQFDKLGYITNNMANQNTTAYKSVRFEQVLNEDGYLDGVVRTDAVSYTHLTLPTNREV